MELETADEVESRLKEQAREAGRKLTWHEELRISQLRGVEEAEEFSAERSARREAEGLVQVRPVGGMTRKAIRMTSGRKKYWWLRKGDKFIKIPEVRGDKGFDFDMELTPGKYTIGVGPSVTAGGVRETFIVEIPKKKKVTKKKPSKKKATRKAKKKKRVEPTVQWPLGTKAETLAATAGELRTNIEELGEAVRDAKERGEEAEEEYGRLAEKYGRLDHLYWRQYPQELRDQMAVKEEAFVEQDRLVSEKRAVKLRLATVEAQHSLAALKRPSVGALEADWDKYRRTSAGAQGEVIYALGTEVTAAESTLKQAERILKDAPFEKKTDLYEQYVRVAEDLVAERKRESAEAVRRAKVQAGKFLAQKKQARAEKAVKKKKVIRKAKKRKKPAKKKKKVAKKKAKRKKPAEKKAKRKKPTKKKRTFLEAVEAKLAGGEDLTKPERQFVKLLGLGKKAKS